MANFRLINSDNRVLEQITLSKASATVIAAGSLVALDASGLAITATATSTKVAFTQGGAANGDLSVSVYKSNNFELLGSAAVNFAAADVGASYDMTAAQAINSAAATIKVLTVSPSLALAGTVGQKLNIRMKIADSAVLY